MGLFLSFSTHLLISIMSTCEVLTCFRARLCGVCSRKHAPHVLLKCLLSFCGTQAHTVPFQCDLASVAKLHLFVESSCHQLTSLFVYSVIHTSRTKKGSLILFRQSVSKAPPVENSILHHRPPSLLPFADHRHADNLLGVGFCPLLVWQCRGGTITLSPTPSFLQPPGRATTSSTTTTRG